MPFDVGDFSGASFSDRAAGRRSRRLVAGWLFTLACMVLVMIGLGGATRLTGSGLSIMEWAPVTGILPPLSHAEWERLFALYKQIPQYTLVNQDFTLADFQGIFWLEWIHRFWGRLLGFAFAIPLVWFCIRGRIERRLVPWLLVLLVLGALQGAVGWFMVASGFLPDTTTVSPYRLVVHLSLALVLYGALIWTGLAVAWPRPSLVADDRPIEAGGALHNRHAARLRHSVIVTFILVSLTIVAGGFVAGTRAGLTYNTFPLMDGQLIPDGYFGPLPFLRNLAENVTAVQFNHRILATLSAVAVLVTLVIGFRTPSSIASRPLLLLLGAALVVQYTLGVITLLLAVPVSLGTAHQVCATLLLTATLVLLYLTGQQRTQGTRG